MDDLNFNDLAPIEVPVKIKGKDYILREASGDAACRWRNSLLAATKLGGDGKPISVGNMADSEPLLVSLCLFEQYEHNGEAKERPVPLSVIRGWPYRVQKALFERAQYISELGERETPELLETRISQDMLRLQALRVAPQEDPVKNGQPATTDG